MSRSRRAPMVSILGATFANYLTITIMTVALRPLSQELRAPIEDVAWVTIAPALVNGLLTPLFGKLGDRYGRRRVFRAGLAGFLVGTIGCAASTTLPELLLFRVVAAASGAASMPSGLALASSLYPPDERAVPMGYWTSITAFAPALGVLFGGTLVESFGSRALFLAQVPFVLLSLGLSYVRIPESYGERDGRFDLAGALLLGAGFLGLTLAVNRANAWGFTSPTFLACVVGSTLALSLLVPVERSAVDPVVPYKTMARPEVASALVSRSLLYGVHMGSFVLLPLMLEELAGLSPSSIALVLLPRPVAMGIASPIASFASRRFGAARVLAVGIATMLLGVLWLTRTPTAPLGPALFASLVLAGLGLGVSQTLTASEIARHTPAHELGASAAMLSIATAFSGSLGSAGLLALAMREGVARPAAYGQAFVTCALLCLVALALVVPRALSRERPTDAKETP